MQSIYSQFNKMPAGTTLRCAVCRYLRAEFRVKQGMDQWTSARHWKLVVSEILGGFVWYEVRGKTLMHNR